MVHNRKGEEAYSHGCKGKPYYTVAACVEVYLDGTFGQQQIYDWDMRVKWANFFYSVIKSLCLIILLVVLFAQIVSFELLPFMPWK